MAGLEIVTDGNIRIYCGSRSDRGIGAKGCAGIVCLTGAFPGRKAQDDVFIDGDVGADGIFSVVVHIFEISPFFMLRCIR